ncbi:DeoR/GlpR family DNA-binding transcription regulator [Vagococcus intermedius]|uniref:DeoR/GlpR family DNA-binding transcription regulator n=1 Tax=Vagococcus intermedius TaxID=2991418 RepID=A0AAF0CT89_9ENTE|nr:DeoR/GlpR family DNA-binding transcription regulator [Vagococcus intermedius]WEG72417.1 DeoR/GlpR family DNA-binding transcription regulator [Vagococcus intermedius]WEG74505.1 DeoR/GlpR family DNA-binding transcription regulator [Vagococcus intermedius]
MKSKRIDEIEKMVLKLETVSIEELCDEFDVSKNTIRRDINELVERDVIEKVYGGIKAKRLPLVSYEKRDDFHREQKRNIAEFASSLIKEGDVIYIDSGTTAAQIPTFLDKDIDCTIITNNFDVVEVCSEFHNANLFVIGSLYNYKTRSFVELDTSAELVNFNINKAFMAATGLTIDNGLTNSDPLEYEMKKKICQNSTEIIAVVDESKFNKSTLLTYCPLSSVNHIISSDNIADRYKEFFIKKEIIYTAIEG